MITFSIIIPVHNVELYLEEAVASVLAQTYRNFELILVDDGSTDNSNIIAEKFAAGDNRICIVTKNAGGAGSARNAGLLLAKGTYVYFMDSDDVIAPATLQKLYDVFSTEATDAVAFTATPFSAGDFRGYGQQDIDNSLNFYRRGFLREGKFTGLSFYETMSRHDNFVASVCLYAVNREVITRNELSFSEGIMIEDELYSRQLFLSCESVYFLADSFYHRRIRPGSVSTSKNEAYRIKSLLIVAESLNRLNCTLNLPQLEADVKRFFYLTIEALGAMDKRNVLYVSLQNALLQSDLSGIYPMDEATQNKVKFKAPGTWQSLLATLKSRVKNVLSS